MKLLTVTCDRDFEEMEMQAKSIQKFLEPVEHLIIVNNSSRPQSDWSQMLIPFYEKHHLRLEFVNEYKNIGGWISQQIWKIRAVEFLDDDYVILDSKNFFVRPTDISLWRSYEGSGKIHNISNEAHQLGQLVGFRYSYHATINYYCNYLNEKFPDECYNCSTPFVAKHSIMTEVNHHRDIFLTPLFKETGESGHSEFLLYSIFARKYSSLYNAKQNVAVNAMGYTFFGTNATSCIDTVNAFEFLKVSGIGRLWCTRVSIDDRTKMLLWLKSLGILTFGFIKKHCN